MKHLIIFILFCVQTSLYSQTNLKFNLLTALVAAPNFGIETKIGSKTTFQIDALASYWKSFNGGPQQFLIVIPEIRYYTKAAFDGFFIGAHFGGSVYKLQKLNYFNTDRYQKGFNYLIGATIGYQYKINDKYSAEMFIGGGSQQAFYKGYSLSTGTRYDGAEGYNKSGEFFPYRVGMMIIYKLK